MSESFINYITAALLFRIPIGFSLHQKNGTIEPTIEVHNLQEAQ